VRIISTDSAWIADPVIKSWYIGKTGVVAKRLGAHLYILIDHYDEDICLKDEDVELIEGEK